MKFPLTVSTSPQTRNSQGERTSHRIIHAFRILAQPFVAREEAHLNFQIERVWYLTKEPLFLFTSRDSIKKVATLSSGKIRWMKMGEKKSMPGGRGTKFSYAHSISRTSSTTNICTVETNSKAFKIAPLNHRHRSMCFDEQPRIKQANTDAIENTFPFYVTSRSVVVVIDSERKKNATSFPTFCLLLALNFRFSAANNAFVFSRSMTLFWERESICPVSRAGNLLFCLNHRNFFILYFFARSVSGWKVS